MKTIGLFLFLNICILYVTAQVPQHNFTTGSDIPLDGNWTTSSTVFDTTNAYFQMYGNFIYIASTPGSGYPNEILWGITQTQGAYLKIFLPPGIGQVNMSVNAYSLAASQCIRTAEIGQFGINDPMPVGAIGNEAWNWGCGAFSRQISRTYAMTEEAYLVYGFYNEDNMHASGFSPNDLSFSFTLTDSIAFYNWLNGVSNCTASIQPGAIAGTQSVCVGSDPDLFQSISPAVGNDSIQYQWEFSFDETSWYEAANETGASWDLVNSDFGITPPYTCYARRRASDCSGTVYSNTIELDVVPHPEISITGNPAESICNNTNAFVLNGSPSGGDFTGNGMVGNAFDPSQAHIGSNDIAYVYVSMEGCVDTAGITIDVENCSVFVEEISATQQYVYPNPTNSYFHISGISSNNAVKIFSLEAKLLREWASPLNVEKFDVTDLPKGYYILSIDGQFRKLIIE